MSVDIEDKLKNFDELKEAVEALRSEGRKIVWTNGCFDFLHIGHAKNIVEAKRFGDILIVGINSDESVKELKGEKRPYNREDERAYLVSVMQPVDYVIIFPEKDCCRYLEAFKPDFYVKGGDYTKETINQGERKIVESYNGKIRLVPKVEGKSTSLIESIIDSLSEGSASGHTYHALMDGLESKKA